MIQEILNNFGPISLEQMDSIKLMNRIDTKFVLPENRLKELLQWAKNQYFVQEVSGLNIIDYQTIYFDTLDRVMYTMHHNGKKTREKIRIRSYLKSNLSFLEVKNKNNHGRTRKKRIQIIDSDQFYQNQIYANFLQKHAWYLPNQLHKQLENTFSRITLVNFDKTERLTIDLNLKFRNLVTGISYNTNNLVIIELKRDGLTFSPILKQLNLMRVKNIGISKYCLGEFYTDDKVKKNLFKERIYQINKIISI